jgi:glycosyltransferase involved in cell wall biosynthesis
LSTPLVSICLITYRHESYIRQSIEGVLMQKVNFEWEFIIAEDHSPDKTRDIVIEYQKKYPSLIRLILQEKNVGPGNNFKDLMNAPKGKYIAYIEGDDYWTDPHKLQQQVDFLEANPQYGLVCTDCVFFSEEKQKTLNLAPQFNSTQDISFEELLVRNRVISMTTVFSVAAYKKASSILDVVERSGWKMGDYPLWLKMATFTKLRYFNYKSGVYRVLMNSATHRNDKEKEMAFEKSVYSVCEFFINEANFKNPSALVQIKTQHLYKMLKFSLLLKDWKRFKEYFKQTNKEKIFLPLAFYFFKSMISKMRFVK